MRMLSTCIGCLVSFLLVACAAEISDSASRETHRITGTVVELLTGEPMANVSACWEEACVETDADGHYVLDVGVGEAAITLDKSEHMGGVVPVVVTEEGQPIANVSLVTEALMSAQLSTVNLHSEPGTGVLAFSISNGVLGDGLNVGGIEVSLGTSQGVGPFYTTSLGLPSLELVETSDNGGGVFVHVPPGEVTLEHLGLPDGCTTVLGWGGPTVLSLPIHADRVTVVRIECLGF